eukprot:jgi/Mesvir1/11972/Mv00291-RA.1
MSGYSSSVWDRKNVCCSVAIVSVVAVIMVAPLLRLGYNELERTLVARGRREAAALGLSESDEAALIALFSPAREGASAQEEEEHPEHAKMLAQGFVRAEGPRFLLGNEEFFVLGWNTYYLIDPWSHPQSLAAQKAAILEVLDTGKALGLNVLRTWAFNDGEENHLYALQARQGVYREGVFRILDFILHEASLRGIRVILPFVNAGTNDYGGILQYVKWANATAQTLRAAGDLAGAAAIRASTREDFFSEPLCWRFYQQHVWSLVHRRNVFTGRLYRDDPTILAWDLANEPRSPFDPTGHGLTRWLDAMSSFVKSIDGNHMVTSGSQGWFGPEPPEIDTWRRQMEDLLQQQQREEALQQQQEQARHSPSSSHSHSSRTATLTTATVSPGSSQAGPGINNARSLLQGAGGTVAAAESLEGSLVRASISGAEGAVAAEAGSLSGHKDASMTSSGMSSRCARPSACIKDCADASGTLEECLHRCAGVAPGTGFLAPGANDGLASGNWESSVAPWTMSQGQVAALQRSLLYRRQTPAQHRAAGIDLHWDPPVVAAAGSQAYYRSLNPPTVEKYPIEWNKTEGSDFVRDHSLPCLDFATMRAYSAWWPYFNMNPWQLKRIYAAWIKGHLQAATWQLNKPLLLEEFGEDAAARDDLFRIVYNTAEMSAREGWALAGTCVWTITDKDYPDYDSYSIRVGEHASTVALIQRHTRRMSSIAAARNGKRLAGGDQPGATKLCGPQGAVRLNVTRNVTLDNSDYQIEQRIMSAAHYFADPRGDRPVTDVKEDKRRQLSPALRDAAWFWDKYVP